MDSANVVTRIDQLLALAAKVKASERPANGASWRTVDHGLIRGFRSAVLSFIELQYGKSHTYYEEFSKAVAGHHDDHINAGISILQAIRGEVEGGWLQSVRGLVAAEIFADFLEMAAHLLSSGYKDAAAVMIGSTLEEHLRRLAVASSVPTEREVDGAPISKRAEALNTDLAKAEVYSKLDQKAVTAWLDLRNKAAHGRYAEYEKGQVELLLQGVTEFMARVPP